MSSSYITISYHIILYLMFFYFISSANLISIPFYSVLFYFISNRFDLIWFYSILFCSIEFDLLCCTVLYLISMNDLCLSVCPSVRPSVCLSVWISLCFLFSLSLSYLFSFSFLFLFSWTSSSHTYTYTDTDTQIHMNICSFLWLVHITSKERKSRIVFEW